MRLFFVKGSYGLSEFEKIVVGSREEYERMQANRKNVLDYAEEPVAEAAE